MIWSEGVCKESTTFRLGEALPRRRRLSDAKVQDPGYQELSKLEETCTDDQLRAEKAALPLTLRADDKDAVGDEEDSSVGERRGNDVERIICGIGKGCASENPKNAREQSGTGTEGNDLAGISSSIGKRPIAILTDIDDHPLPIAAPGSMVQL